MAKKKVAAKENEIGEFFNALADLAAEKGIEQNVFVAKIESAIEKSLKTNLRIEDKESDAVQVHIDLDKQIFDVSILKEIIEVVDTLYDPETEIVLEEARKIDPTLQVGDMVRCPIDTHEFKRIAAKNAKDLIKQGFRDVERQQLSEMWGMYENEAVSALVTRVEPKTGHATIEINKNETLLMRNDQIPGETLVEGQVVKVYITGVSREYKEGAKKQSLRITRTDKGLIKRLFELECPEIYEGVVEIKSISRAPGSRSKMAVISNDPNVDAVGACIGPQKSRINAVTKEIKGEKVDVVLYNEEPEEFIKQALKPAEVTQVVINDPSVRACKAIVPDNQLSLAIGNKGQNAWLAAKLTGYKIDIKAESKVTPEDLKVIELPEPQTEEAAEETVQTEE
ncbi:MAG: transcription termination/antitermination protein NusA [Oscillospiraceae bacterium]|nr:transcription termination/antitermination protein NusA [Oscillospiraceae bacterium]